MYLPAYTVDWKNTHVADSKTLLVHREDYYPMLQHDNRADEEIYVLLILALRRNSLHQPLTCHDAMRFAIMLLLEVADMGW
jgi:hypothetical protein